MSEPIAAYYVAMMRLDRSGEGDTEAARTLLERSAKLGDAKAAKRLKELKLRSL